MSFEGTIRYIKNGWIKTNLNIIKRRIWPSYCYHFTNIDNAIKILGSGYLYSRKRAYCCMGNDNANRDIIANTQKAVLNYVRLYFRPQVPTLYNNEGFRSKNCYQNARCPFPVYFLFDLASVLKIVGARFSPVSLAIHQTPQLLSGEDEFAKLPFDLIYNDSRFANVDREKYVRHEQAEIVVPDQLSLSYLSKLVVRSRAEADTLKKLIIDYGLNDYLDKIEIDEDGLFFFKRWSYIEDVVLKQDSINLSAHVGEGAFPLSWKASRKPLIPDEADTYIDYKAMITDTNRNVWRWPAANTHRLVVPRVDLSLKNIYLHDYTLRVFMDDEIAYFGEFDAEFNLPF